MDGNFQTQTTSDIHIQIYVILPPIRMSTEILLPVSTCNFCLSLRKKLSSREKRQQNFQSQIHSRPTKTCALSMRE